MIDPILYNIKKYTVSEYLYKELKREFLEPYRNHYDLDFLPKSHYELDDYCLTINDTILFADNSAEIKQVELNYNFEKFLINRFVNDLKFFYKDYNDAIKFEYDSSKKAYYTKALLNQLSNISNELLDNTDIEKKHNNELQKVFNRFINNFNEKYNLTYSDTSRLPNSSSFTFVYEDKEYFKDVVNNLCSSLKRGGLISKLTNKTQIRKLLTNKKLSNKIIWCGDIQEFKYFIDILLNHKSIKPIRRYKWVIAINCFSVLDEKTNEEIKPSKLKAQKLPSKIKRDKIEKYLKL